MPKIRIELEVPDDDCLECKYSSMSYGRLYCALFGVSCPEIRSKGYGYTFNRCQSCIDAEVKEG